MENPRFSQQFVATVLNLSQIARDYPEEVYGSISHIENPWVQANVERAFNNIGLLETDLREEEIKDRAMFWFDKLNEFNKRNLRDSGLVSLKIIPVRYRNDSSILDEGRILLELSPGKSGVKLGEFARMVRDIRGF